MALDDVLGRSLAKSRGSWGVPRGCTLDRKSTRLNSSHVAISYAVFCLKKKKPTRSRPRPMATGSALPCHALPPIPIQSTALAPQTLPGCQADKQTAPHDLVLYRWTTP